MPFVKCDCAALTPTLIESELFGHEKGAFTGAHARRIGRFELASGGTLFLDEIGEMPLQTQAKLLGVLQDRQVQRVGGTTSIPVDIRVIAASNRDLRAEVERGAFREDLYYRLNVLNVYLPPLRERIEDILPLVAHFVRVFNRTLGRSVESISPSARASLMSYEWPGNIRELENVIERARPALAGRGARARRRPRAGAAPDEGAGRGPAARAAAAGGGGGAAHPRGARGDRVADRRSTGGGADPRPASQHPA